MRAALAALLEEFRLQSKLGGRWLVRLRDRLDSEAGEHPRERTGSGDDGGKDEGGERTDPLVAGGVEGEDNEDGGADACGDGGGEASRNSERADQCGFADPEHGESDEFE